MFLFVFRQPVHSGGDGVEHAVDFPEEKEGVPVAMGFDEGDDMLLDGLSLLDRCLVAVHGEVESEVSEGGSEAVAGICAVYGTRNICSWICSIGISAGLSGIGSGSCGLDGDSVVTEEFEGQGTDIEGAEGRFGGFPQCSVEFVPARGVVDA